MKVPKEGVGEVRVFRNLNVGMVPSFLISEARMENQPEMQNLHSEQNANSIGFDSLQCER